VDLTVVAEALGMEVRDLTWRRDPKLMKHKPADPGRKPRLRAKARVSDDRQGKQKSVSDQVAVICRVAREDFGQERDADFYVGTDNSKSASDHGVYRPEWEDLCRAVAVFGMVDIVIVWAVNRLSRLHTEGKHFMWLCWRNDVKVLVLKDYLEDKKDGGDGSRGIYDLRRKRDWKAFDQAFREAEEESQAKSDDIGRGHEGNREKGKLAGAVPGGWVRRYDKDTGECSHFEVVLEQAAVLVMMVRWLAAGTTPSMVAHKLNQLDIPPFTPRRKDGSSPNRFGTWSAPSVVVTALNPAHIGKICPKPLGLDKRRDLTAALLDATQYFPIVRGPVIGGQWTGEQREVLGWHGTEEEWIALWETAVARYLSGRADRAGTTYEISKVRAGGSTHLLSYIALCDVCGGPLRLQVYTRPGTSFIYLTCEKSGHVSVREDWADEYVEERVTAKLSSLIRDGGYQAADPGALAKALAERDQKVEFWDARITQLEQEAKGAEGAAEAAEAERKKKAALAELDARVRTLKIPLIVRDYWDTGGDPALIAAQRASKDMSARRGELKSLAIIRVARCPLGPAQKLRLDGEQRRQVARGQMRVEWRDDYRQDGDGVHADDGGEQLWIHPVSPGASWVLPEGMQWCTACHEVLPLDAEHFYRASATGRTRPTATGFMNVCKVCACARQRRYKAERRRREGVADGEEVSA
jgi:hypothetical protein